MLGGGFSTLNNIAFAEGIGIKVEYILIVNMLVIAKQFCQKYKKIKDKNSKSNKMYNFLEWHGSTDIAKFFM